MLMSKNILSDSRDSLLNSLRKEITVYFPDELEDYSHGMSHTKRVCKIVEIIHEKEGGDLLVLSVAALLHDIARVHEEIGECINHAIKGGELAKEILSKYGLSDNIIDQIVYYIINHRSNQKGETLESKILRDADKLDCLGAISISRIIASSLQSRQYSRPIYDPLIPLNGCETASSLHYIILLIEKYKKGEIFLTETANTIARERIEIMSGFAENFKKELYI
ncbi:MAG: HD domain-containing protein [Candidatus Pacebacteria bacterium]|nr:HD domain-containing protein [Candidatus Paceibacterota bacterium]